jgi:activator of HSP90 ATPase
MKKIEQIHFINASPEEVFTAITNPFTIELWSGYPAKMEAKENTEFSLFDGDIAGRNLKVIENKLLVQEWYFGDREEESIVTIHLKQHMTGTKVMLEQINIPDEEFDELEKGWKLYYWGAIIKFFK